MFVQQWRRTGRLNGHIEETFSGHALVKVFGRQGEAERVFAEENDELWKASFGAQFVSGLIMPIMMFVGNLNYVVIAVLGGLRVASGTMSLGDVQAFIQYSRQFTQPLTQVASMVNLLQSGVASAERVFELLDAEEQEPDRDGARGHGAARRGALRGRVLLLRPRRSRSSRASRWSPVRARRSPSSGPTGAGKTTLVNLVERFYESHGGRITLDGVDITSMPRSALRGQIGMVLQDTWLFAGHHPRQHRLRAPRRDRGGDPPGRRGDVRGPLRALAARRLRHAHRRGGLQPVRGGAAAGDDRPGVPRGARSC